MSTVLRKATGRTPSGGYTTEDHALTDLEQIEALFKRLGLWYNIDTDKRPPSGKIKQIRVSATLRLSD